MALEIAKTFVVNAAPEKVWGFLVDLPRVARCLPGAAIGEKVDEKTSTGTMTIKVGPVSSTYRGKVVFERLDPAGRTAELSASGQDVRGKGGADLRLTSSLKALPGGQTEVTAVSVVNVTGILAQMGRGMIQDVSDEMFQIFSERMRAELESSGGAAGSGRPADGAGPAVGASGAGSATAGGGSSVGAVGPGSAPSGAGTSVGAAGAASGGARSSASSAGPVTGGAKSTLAGGGPSASPGIAPTPARRTPDQPEALDAAALGVRVARRSAARLVRQPAFWAVVLIVAAGLAYLLLQRSSSGP
jgi:carbon monoxide dehydrogenase subunit G